MNPSPSEVVEAPEVEGASASISPTTPNVPAVTPAAEEPSLALIHADVATLRFILATDLHKSGTSRRVQVIGFCFMVPAQDSGGGRGAIPDLNLPPPELIRKVKSRCIFQFTNDFVTWFLDEHCTPDESEAYAAMKSGIAAEAQPVWKADSVGISNMLFLSRRGKIEHALQHVDQALVEALDQLEDLNIPTPQEQVHAPPPDYKAPTQDDAAAVAANQKLPDCVGVIDDENLVNGDEHLRQDLKRKAVDDAELQIIDKKAAHGGNLGIDA